MYSLRYAPVLIYDVPKLIYDYSDVGLLSGVIGPPHTGSRWKLKPNQRS